MAEARRERVRALVPLVRDATLLLLLYTVILKQGHVQLVEVPVAVRVRVRV